MKILISEKIPRIVKNKKNLEKKLNVTLEIKGQETIIDGSPEDEFIAEKVIDALNFGFPFKQAISIKEQDLEFEEINLKDHTPRKDYETIRGRVIGKSGKALKTLSELSDCFIEIKGNHIGIIGEPLNIESTIQALIQLIQGAKHGNVYKGLENQKPEPVQDLGLKKRFIKNNKNL